MRHLNKIIFLNSANIPYAEVMLDGNVHFAGTQGVGKSTLLRALLFFYNADKSHLGLQPGQKSFEEFYFKYSNSYIVYEVATDHGAYSILLFRSQGKAVYRFIDAPYSRDWFVGADGRVESDWLRIRERIGARVDISAKIDTYEQYRNIIFGNTHDRSHRFDKYAIVESPKYQNIPRSIQNVFLNSKLDADFVKTTIIQSMADEDAAIQLSTYRRQVGDFEREFDEIDCWFRKDANGVIVVRTKAARVIESYRLIVALDQEIMRTWHQLNFAVARTREELPLKEAEIETLNEKLLKLKEKLENLRESYAKEHDQLVGKISKCKVRLDDIREKRKRYDELNIGAILEDEEKQPILEAEKAQKVKQLSLLEKQYGDVAEKYRALQAALDEELKGFGLAQKAQLQRHRESMQTERDRLAKTRDAQKRASKMDGLHGWMARKSAGPHCKRNSTKPTVGLPSCDIGIR